MSCDLGFRCLMQLDVMRAFRRCCPFHKEIRGEIVVAIRKGAAEWFTFELQRYKLAQ
jgi:BAI1-associated protein 3